MAISCAPCVIVLENVDAFAQTTQRSENNKGTSLCDILGRAKFFDSYLVEPAVVSVFRDCISELPQAWKRTMFPVVVVGTSSQVEVIPSGILTCFKQEISCDVSLKCKFSRGRPYNHCQVPNEREREDILKAALEKDVLARMYH